jgi:hypothetical protein
MHTKCLFEHLKGREHLGKADTAGRMMPKWILEK